MTATSGSPVVLPVRSLWSGVLFGVGLIAFVDEAVFHQILGWHHFYDLSTTEVGLASDGIFHAVSWFATISSLFLFADLRRRTALSLPTWIGGVLLGAGAFQLFDGTVQHKVLGIHEVRYVDELLPYDLAWNGSAIVLIVAGAIVLIRARRREGTERPGRPRPGRHAQAAGTRRSGER